MLIFFFFLLRLHLLTFAFRTFCSPIDLFVVGKIDNSQCSCSVDDSIGDWRELTGALGNGTVVAGGIKNVFFRGSVVLRGRFQLVASFFVYFDVVVECYVMTLIISWTFVGRI